MRIILHSCCAPCLVYPLEDLRSEGHEVTAFFYNPNIHPYSEYLRRLDAFRLFTSQNGVPIIDEGSEDGLEQWLRQVVFREKHRCRICFSMRLGKTAQVGEAKGFDAFSTTLLYSRFQSHKLLRSTGEAISDEHGIPFHYRDWRKGWNQGVKKYRQTGLYRQKYCGCIYSEKERASRIVQLHR
ncbi:epoxyqueuosine reductase QueH [Thermodesulfobacteriota bacterium]